MPWVIATADENTGVLTTIAAIDWSSKISGADSTFAGGWVRNADGTPFHDGDGYHLQVQVSIGGLTSFKIYGTHSTDLINWSDPVDLGLDQANTYDPQTYKIGSTFYQLNKKDTEGYIGIATSSTVEGTYTMQKTGDWAGWGGGLEGCFMYRPANDVGWIMMFEAYATTHLMYYSTCSTDDPTACTWSAKSLWTEDRIYRHGSVTKLQ